MIDVKEDRSKKKARITIKGSVQPEKVRKFFATAETLRKKGTQQLDLDATYTIPSQKIMNLYRAVVEVNKKAKKRAYAQLWIRRDAYNYCVKELGYSELTQHTHSKTGRPLIKTVKVTEEEVRKSLKRTFLISQKQVLLSEERQTPEERGFNSYTVDVLEIRRHSVVVSFHDLSGNEHELIMNRKAFALEGADFKGAKVAIIIRYDNGSPVTTKLELLNRKERPVEKISKAKKEEIRHFFEALREDIEEDIAGKS